MMDKEITTIPNTRVIKGDIYNAGSRLFNWSAWYTDVSLSADILRAIIDSFDAVSITEHYRSTCYNATERQSCF